MSLSRVYDLVVSTILLTPNAISPFAPYRHWDITHKRAYTTHSIMQSFALAGFRTTAIKEALSRPASLKTTIKWGLWRFVVRPIIKLFCLACHGSDFGGVFTKNIIAVGTSY